MVYSSVSFSDPCNKISFYRYLGDRLRVPGAAPIPPLPDLVRKAAAPA